MRLTIALVGCGNIGMRHLQALALSKHAAAIHVVDLNAEAIEAGRRLFVQEGGDPSLIRGASRVEDLPAELDIAIVATSADQRLALLSSLLEGRRVRWCVLEKFLFQSLSDYSVAQALLNEKGAAAWVNCPRRMWPGYRQLARELGGGEGLGMHFAAPHTLGIGTTAIHLVDVFAYLTGTTDLVFDGQFEPQLGRQKRGHVEFSGRLQARSGRGILTYTCHSQGEGAPMAFLECAKRQMVIREFEQKAQLRSAETEWRWEDVTFETAYQSRLTNLVVDQLAETGTCDLPCYSDSAKLHLGVLKALLPLYESVTGAANGLCPIT